MRKETDYEWLKNDERLFSDCVTTWNMSWCENETNKIESLEKQLEHDAREFYKKERGWLFINTVLHNLSKFQTVRLQYFIEGTLLVLYWASKNNESHSTTCILSKLKGLTKMVSSKISNWRILLERYKRSRVKIWKAC